MTLNRIGGYILGGRKVASVYYFVYLSQRFFLLFGMEEEKSFLMKALFWDNITGRMNLGREKGEGMDGRIFIGARWESIFRQNQ